MSICLFVIIFILFCFVFLRRTFPVPRCRLGVGTHHFDSRTSLPRLCQERTWHCVESYLCQRSGKHFIVLSSIASLLEFTEASYFQLTTHVHTSISQNDLVSTLIFSTPAILQLQQQLLQLQQLQLQTTHTNADINTSTIIIL